MRTLIAILVIGLASRTLQAADKTIGVFIALADNQHQGIVPVPAAIGKGDDPERNLYWGTADGLKGVFDRSNDWKLAEKNDTPTSSIVLRTRVYRHVRKDATLTARAYDGKAIKECIRDCEAAISAGSYDLVVFIGHNGLMDFDLPAPAKPDRQTRVPDCIVLCCKSERYFKSRIEAAGGRPVLLTTQLMYPGAFILRASAEPWLDGKGPAAIRESAAEAYAKNQKIARKAALGVFAGIGG